MSLYTPLHRNWTSMFVDCFFVFESMTDEPKGLRLKLFLKSQYVEFLRIIKIFFYAARDTVAAVLPMLTGKGNRESN